MKNKLVFIINIPRIIILIIIYPFVCIKRKSIHDYLVFINYGSKRKYKSKMYSLINLLIHVKEYRNVLYLRQNNFIKFILLLFFKPMSELYITTHSEDIGKGLLIVHGFSTIINAKSIGNNCTIYQQVTIGYGSGGLPVIGSNVKIFAGAIIVGNVHIGDNSIIGAGTVITKNVPEDSICVGSRFRVIPSK